MPIDVFISYSRKDAEFALKLMAELEQRGINVWIDQGDIVAGDAWRKQIVEGIEACKIFLVMLSPQSAQSANVVKELSIAESNRKKIIPILYQPVTIPKEMEYQLAGLQYQAFDRGNYEENLARLVGAITGPSDSKAVASLPDSRLNVPVKRTATGGNSKNIGLALGIGCIVVLLLIAGTTIAFMLSQGTLASTKIAEATTTTPSQTPLIKPTTPVPTTPAPITVIPTTPALVSVRACAKLPNMPVVSTGQLGSPSKPIVIVFGPSSDAATILKAGTDIADCLGKATGLVYQAQVLTGYAASVEAMGASKAQIGFLNLFAYLSARDKYGVSAGLVWDRLYLNKLQNYYLAEFITSVRSGIKTLADLKGSSFCFIDPNSTSGYIVPQAMLKANGIDLDKDLKSYVFTGSHPSVASAIYKGECAAGVAFVDVLTDASTNLAKSYPDIQDKVRVFAYTDKIPNDGVQFVKDFDPRLRSATIDALIAMANDSDGKATLRRLYGGDTLEKQGDTFYDDFRALLKKAGVNVDQYVK